MKYHSFNLFLVILFIGLAVRLFNIDQPLLEYNATRQVETAMIVRNFAFGGFHFLYPEVDDNGRGPSCLMQEFPIITMPLALICNWMGEIPEWLLRISSLIFFSLAAVLFYKFIATYYNPTMALLSSAIFIFSPLSILMSRTFQPDMAMIFFIFLTFFYFKKWLEDINWRHFTLAAIGFVGVVLLKVTNLYILLPISYLVLSSFKKRSLSWRLTLFFIFVSLPIVWWWGYHTVKIRAIYYHPGNVTFNLSYILNSMKYFLLHGSFYKEVFKHIFLTTLTPLIFIFFLYGLFIKVKNKKESFLFLWFLGVILFFLIVPEQSKQEYYMLSLVPVASIFAAKGILNIMEKVKNKRLIKIVASITILVTVLFIARIVMPKYLNRPIYADIIEAGKTVDRFTEKDALVIASHGYGPDFLYYCNRKGWDFPIDREDLIEYYKNVKIVVGEHIPLSLIDHLESLRKNGAKYFASVDIQDFNKDREFKEYMTKNYKCLASKDNMYIIFDLRK